MANNALQNHSARWYDPSTGTWISEDPISFAAGDANLYRYVGNGVTALTDPSGLAPNQKETTDPQYVLDRIKELQDEGMSNGGILFEMARLQRDETLDGMSQFRYMYTEEFGWIDLEHFFYTAYFAYYLGEAGWELTQVGGWFWELIQTLFEVRDEVFGTPVPLTSGFSPEDLPSHYAGGEFGEDFAPFAPSHYDDLAEALDDYFGSIGALPQDHPNAGKDKLPKSDPGAGPWLPPNGPGPDIPELRSKKGTGLWY